MRPFQKFRKGIGYGTGAVVVAGGIGYCVDEGFARFVDFQRLVMPIALKYFTTDWATRAWPQHRRDKIFNPMHEKYAQPILDIVLRQKGFYVKIAQFASSMPGTVPDAIADKLRYLQEDAPARPYEVVKQIIEKEFGRPLDQIFTDFDEVPLHAASIGQVHLAKLTNGTEVAVKVQYPEAEHTFSIDMKLFIAASTILRPDAVLVLKQLQKNFANEFDYRNEAVLQRKACKLVQESGRSHIMVPEPFDAQNSVAQRHFPELCTEGGTGLCTKSCFVMERLHGESIQKFGCKKIAEMADEKGTTETELRHEMNKLTHADMVNMMPSRTVLNLYRNYVWLYNNTLGLFGGKIEIPFDIYAISDDLFDVTSHLLFERGFCNGDPHPGNIMLLVDGRIALIDWGQVREYNAEEIKAMASLIVAVAVRDEVQTSRFAHELGYKTKTNSDWVANKWANFVFGCWDEYTVGDIGGVILAEEVLNKIDPLLDLIDDKLVAGRCLIMTRMTLATLGLPINSAKASEQAARRCLGRGCPEMVPGRKGPEPPENLAAVVSGM